MIDDDDGDSDDDDGDVDVDVDDDVIFLVIEIVALITMEQFGVQIACMVIIS